MEEKLKIEHSRFVMARAVMNTEILTKYLIASVEKTPEEIRTTIAYKALPAVNNLLASRHGG